MEESIFFDMDTAVPLRIIVNNSFPTPSNMHFQVEIKEKFKSNFIEKKTKKIEVRAPDLS